MTQVGWMTNNRKVAQQLRAADYIYDAAKRAARNLPLAEKIVAVKLAKAERDKAYTKAQP